MSPEQQHLEEFFQSIKPGDGLPGDFEPTDEKAEFDAFFEKLSSLDDLDLGNDPAQSEPEPWIASPSPARQRSTGRKPAVFRSDSAEPRVARAAQKPKDTQRPSRQRETHQRETIRREHTQPAESSIASHMKTITKFAVMACVLFAFGMGAGWLALSLPERFAKTGTTLPPSLEPVESTPVAQNDQPGTAEIDLAPVQNDDTARREAALPVAEPTPQIIPTIRQPVAPRIKTPPETQKPPLLSKAGSYSLQVGACSSEECVTRYRKMLSSHVGVEKIQVTKIGSDGAGSLILRVRIAPLDKPAAEDLKVKLATVDNRFKDAYVIAIN